MSCQGDGDGAVCSTAASSVDAGLCEFLAVLLWLLVCNSGQETQRDRVPLLWQQQQQETQADDAGGCQAHHTEDHLVFQNIHGYSRERKTGTREGAGEQQKEEGRGETKTNWD